MIFGFEGFNSLSTVLFSAVNGAGYLAELLTSLVALRTAPLVLCNLCALGGSIILPSVASIFLFDEPMSLVRWSGVLLFFSAVYFLSPTQANKQPFTLRAAGILLLNFLINGMLSLLGKYYAMKVEGANAAAYPCFSYAFAALFFAVAILLTVVGKKRKAPVTKQPPLPRPLPVVGPILGATCASIVFLSIRFARVVPLVIMNTVPSAVSIIGCLFLGKWLFRETITPRQLLGAFFGVAAAVLMVCF